MISNRVLFSVLTIAALAVGLGGFLIGLWNSGIGMEEKGFYFTVMAFSMFSAVSVQKSVRDRIEGIPVSDMYYGIWLVRHHPLGSFIGCRSF